jgi:hypothetical protein
MERATAKANEMTTKIWAEDIQSRISNRLLDNEWANLSDLLGSDWIVFYGFPRNPTEYKAFAMAAAFAKYPSYWERKA